MSAAAAANPAVEQASEEKSLVVESALYRVEFSNRGADGAALEFVIVGKKVNNVPVSLITQDDDFLTVKSDEFGITFEGRFNKETGEIKGTLSQGPLEAPLLLRRTM